MREVSELLSEMGELGSSSLMAACSMVVKRPLFFGLRFKMGNGAGGGDFLDKDVKGLSNVEAADELEGVGNV